MTSKYQALALGAGFAAVLALSACGRHNNVTAPGAGNETATTPPPETAAPPAGAPATGAPGTMGAAPETSAPATSAPPAGGGGNTTGGG